MSSHPYPTTLHFLYELDVEITSMLSISSGELGMMLADGLFALDGEGLLFPGATIPETRLHRATIGAIGYSRYDRSPPLGAAYRHLLNREPAAGDPDRALFDLTEGALATIGAASMKQRTLMSRLLAIADRCRHGDTLGDEERAAALIVVGAALDIARDVDTKLAVVL